MRVQPATLAQQLLAPLQWLNPLPVTDSALKLLPPVAVDIVAAVSAACVVTAAARSAPCVCQRIHPNSTISKQAAECGCPYAGGFKFTSSGYIFYVTNVSSCESSYNPAIIVDGGRRGLQAARYGYGGDTYNSNATIYTGNADMAATHIEYVHTSYGYKEVKVCSSL